MKPCFFYNNTPCLPSGRRKPLFQLLFQRQHFVAMLRGGDEIKLFRGAFHLLFGFIDHFFELRAVGICDDGVGGERGKTGGLAV